MGFIFKSIMDAMFVSSLVMVFHIKLFILNMIVFMLNIHFIMQE